MIPVFPRGAASGIVPRSGQVPKPPLLNAKKG